MAAITGLMMALSNDTTPNITLTIVLDPVVQFLEWLELVDERLRRWVRRIQYHIWRNYPETWSPPRGPPRGRQDITIQQPARIPGIGRARRWLT